MSKKVEAIKSKQVILIGDSGEKLGEFMTVDAQNRARDQELDLVRVGGTDGLPICKIMDYGKYLYNKKKKEKRNKQAAVKTKEIKFRVTTDKNDLSVSAGKTDKFLSAGHRVKVTVNARGREAAHKNLLYERMTEFLSLVKFPYEFDSKPKEEGRSLTSTIVLKNNKKNNDN